MFTHEPATTHHVDLAPPEDPARLAAEITGARCIHQLGPLEIREFHGDEAPAIMREIGRIREREYRAMGAGRNVSADIDRYDTTPYLYRQIVVWDHAARQLVAMYRYALCAEVLRRQGPEGLRTASLFSWSPRFQEQVLRHAVELGRSVVNREARTAMRGLHAIWHGLAWLSVRNPSVHYYFGNVTIPATLPSGTQNHILTMLHGSCPPDRPFSRDDVRRRVPRRSRDGHRGPTGELRSSGPMENGYRRGDHRRALALVQERIGPQHKVPSILVSYLKRTHRLWAFDHAEDLDFGGATETAIVVPVDGITDATRTTFFHTLKEVRNGRIET